MREKLGKREIHEVAESMKNNILWLINRKEKTGYGE